MLLKEIELFPLKESIKDLDRLYAHTKSLDTPKETLEEHLACSIKYFDMINKKKELNKVWPRIYECLKLQSQEEIKFFNELFINAIYIHDIGKININYQFQKMGNNNFKEGTQSEKHHSIISAVIYMDYYINKIKQLSFESKTRDLMVLYVMVNGYIIARHHSDLIELEDFQRELSKCLNNYNKESNLFKLYKCDLKLSARMVNKIYENVINFIGKEFTNWDSLYVYIYSKYLYSLLVACDYYATSEYIHEESIEDIGILDNIDNWQAVYSKSLTYKSIQVYKSTYFRNGRDLREEKDINNLRSELFLEADQTLLKNINESIFYLEAPTGSGKTNTSIQLALTLLKHSECNKLIYVFPFNTLVEQTKNSLEHIFLTSKEILRDLTVINSITPIKSKNKDRKYDEEQVKDIEYNKMLLDRQFFHYPTIITSHVQLFNVFFSNEKMQACTLYQLANSVIVLDEIQSYKNTIWKEIILFLKAYAKMLNIKIIIMSATLPKLDELIEEDVKIPSLIKNKEKYFKHPLFKDRVRLDFSLLEEENVYDRLVEKVLDLDKQSQKNILVEFIKKKTAMNFYNKLIELKNDGQLVKKVLLITGDDNKWEREKCIKAVKSNKDIILISTQVIEAGVDIDMDIGFKDISLLDFEEQFLGRINRSCKKENCYVYFFNLDNAAMIYKNDYRKNKEYTLLSKEMQIMLMNKDFTDYYRCIFECIKKHNKKLNEGNLEDFKKDHIQRLDYKSIDKRMQLIDEDIYPITVFLGMKINLEDEEGRKTIDGCEVWERYKNLLKDHTLTYAEKKVKLSYLREEMECFTWRVSKSNFTYSDKIGDMYYIENGEEYFENGKFNREKISGSSFEIL